MILVRFCASWPNEYDDMQCIELMNGLDHSAPYAHFMGQKVLVKSITACRTSVCRLVIESVTALP